MARALCLIACVFLTLCVVANAQCIPGKLDVIEIAGRVIIITKKGEEVLKDASVSVLEDRLSQKLLAKTVVDADGHFKIPIKPGTYILKVERKSFMDFIGRIQVRPHRRNLQNDSEIVVILGYDFNSECGGSSASVCPVRPRTP